MDTSVNFNESIIGNDAGQENRTENRKAQRVEATIVDLGPLSPKEARTFKYQCEGLQKKQIAQRVSRSLSTVSTQLEAVYEKLGAHNSTQALAIAISRGIVTVSLACFCAAISIDDNKLMRPRGQRQQITQRQINGRTTGEYPA